jgi:hypothetical protein
MGVKRNAYVVLVGKPEGKRPLGRPGPRWVDNIRTDLVEVGWGDVDLACSTNGFEEERLLVVGRKARGKKPTRKSKT